MSSAVSPAASGTGPDSAVILALGSRVRGDDAIGPFVADEVVRTIDGCRVVEGCNDAMAIVNAWEDAAVAVVVDAAMSGAPPGTIRRLEMDAAPLAKDLARCSSHGLGLAEAVQLARVLQRLPARLIVYAIEASSFEPGAGLSPAVAAATTKVAREIAAELVAPRGE